MDNSTTIFIGALTASKLIDAAGSDQFLVAPTGGRRTGYEW